jgi:Ca2+/Na+ antiporter
MSLALAVLIIGLILLVFSVYWFIESVLATVAHLGLPPLSIGLLKTNFSIHAPETQLSARAVYRNSPSSPQEFADECSD